MRDQSKEIQHSHYCSKEIKKIDLATKLPYDQLEGAKSSASKRQLNGGAPLSDAFGRSSRLILARDFSQYIPQVESLPGDEI